MPPIPWLSLLRPTFDVFRGWRKIPLLPWRQRSLVLAAGYAGLLPVPCGGKRRSNEGLGMEQNVPGAGDASLRWRAGARPIRHACAVVKWVEKGDAPESVIATGRAFPGRSRQLCPYPKHAQYLGRGDTNDAANFSCQ